MKKLKIISVILAALILTGFTSCIFNFGSGIKGNGNIVKESRVIGNFNELDVSGMYKVYLTQGDKNSLEIKADENLMQYLVVKTKNNELKIKVKENIDPTKIPVIFLTFKSLEGIDLSGACEVIGSEMKFDKLEIEGSGATDFDLNMKAAEVKFDLSGASKVLLHGKADKAAFDGSGAVKINAFEFVINDCNIDLSGACNAKVNVSERLSIELSGASNLYYKGNPQITKMENSGVSTVKKAK